MKILKFLLVFCVFILTNNLSLCFEISREIKQAGAVLHSICHDEVGVAEEILTDSNLPDDDKLKCYIDCIFRKMEVIAPDGSISYEHYYGMLPDDLVVFLKKITNACGTKFGKDACDTAWLTTRCYFEVDSDASKFQGILN